MDICLPVLKRKAAEERDQVRRTAIQIAINIIAALPQEEIQEGVICRDCYYYGKEQHVCRHTKGLHGRVRPEMFCSYGCKADDNSGDDEPTEDFSEFEEVAEE
jgi:hypothetical protein